MSYFQNRQQEKYWVFAFCFLFFAGSGTVAANDSRTEFDRANRLYQVGNYTEAAKIYEALAEHADSAQKEKLYFNLANSEYRLDRLSPAILNYERVLALNPRHADAKYNLRAAKAKLEYKIEDRRHFFIRFHGLVLQWVKSSELGTAVLTLLLLFLVLSIFWMKRFQTSAFWAFPRSEVFAIFLLAVVFWGAKLFYEVNYREAIVLASEAEVRYGPSIDNQSLMKLGGGLKVFVVDRRDDWSRVLTWNGETGWMRDSDLGWVKA